MNKIQLLLAGVGIAALSISAVCIQSFPSMNPDYISFRNKKIAKKAMKSQSIHGAAAYYKQVVANQITGEINPADVVRAKDQMRALASAKKTRAFQNIKWSERGPNNIGGRTRTVITDRNNSNKLYMGAVGGGFWTSTDNGNTWAKRDGNDTTSAIAISTIAQAANGDIYYGTGEGVGGFAGSSWVAQIFQLGEGIFKSTDGGATFNQLASTKPANVNSPTDQWAYVNKIVAHPTNPDLLFAATYGGLRVTNNGGTTWTKPTGLTSSNAHFLDVEMSADGSRVVAATGSNLYISNDGGTTFGNNIMGQNGLPTSGQASRIDISIAPSDANYVYLTIAAPNGSLRGVYKSIDGGATWSAIGLGGSAIFNPLTTQGNYNIAFGVHPTNKDMVFLGGTFELLRYTPTNGWETIAFWIPVMSNNSVVHADMHVIHFNPSNPENMYVATDGGLYRTFNCTAPLPTFAVKNKNYATAQCYGVSANILGHVAFGTQDNGSGLIGLSGNSPLESRDLTGGDGMRNALSDYLPNFVFTSIYYGELFRAADGGLGNSSFKSFFDKNIDADANGEPTEGALWVAPIDFREKIDPITQEVKSVFLFGTNSSIWMTQGALKGNSVWFRIFNPGAVGFSAITMSDDGKTVFAAAQGGSVYRISVPSLWENTYKYNDTVTNMPPTGAPYNFPLRDSITSKTIGSFPGRFVTDLSCNNSGNTLLVTLGNYSNSAYIYKSLNAVDDVSPTFTDITSNLPKMPVYTSICVKGSSNQFMIGTELGIWGTDNGGTSWTELNMMNPDPTSWHPRVATYEIIEKPMLKSVTDGDGYIGSIIYTGTHGRGVFRSTSMSTYFPNQASFVAQHAGSIQLYPNPAVNQTTIEYDAENSSNVNIKIYSLMGSLVKDMMYQTSVGKNRIPVDLSTLAQGGYIVYLNDNGNKASKTLIKQ